MAKQSFSRKILTRLDRIDRKSMEQVLAELVRENELQEKILNSLEEGLLITNSVGIVTTVNEPLLRLSEEKGSAIQGHPLVDFLSRLGLDSQDIEQNLFQYRQTVSNDIFLEKPAPLWVRLYGVPFTDEEGNFLGTCLTFKDITRLKQQDQQRRHAERLNTLLPLAAGLAHEIGNPLNSLDIHIQLAQRELRDIPESKKKKIGRCLDVAKEEIERLDRTVKQFLGAIRPLKSNFQLKNVNEILDAALDFMSPEISMAKVTVERRFQTQLPPTLIDEDQLKQAFFNLIKNAVQAMPKGGLLRVETEAKNQQIRILFADTGIGISVERLRKIFEPYYSTKEKGSGLGLVIVSRVVSEHGGSVQVKSALGKGTQFVVMLPIVTSLKPLLPPSEPPTRGRKKKREAR